MTSLCSEMNHFKGKPPPKVQTGMTDYELEKIPRAIYNDPVQDMLLREEGYSGKSRQEVLQLLKPLKPAHPGIKETIQSYSSIEYHYQHNLELNADDATGNIMRKAELEGDTRTVIVTDCSIEIINPHIHAPIRPFNKPKYRSPLDRPVHSESKHKALPPSFQSVVRYGSAVNKLSVTSQQTIHSSRRQCFAMEHAMKESIKPHVLRYNRQFESIESTCIVRGLSFRGRGHLDVRMGWSTAAEIEADDKGDITATIKESENRSSPLYSAEKFLNRGMSYQAEQQKLTPVCQTPTCKSATSVQPLPIAFQKIDLNQPEIEQSTDQRSWPAPSLMLETIEQTTVIPEIHGHTPVHDISVGIDTISIDLLPELPEKPANAIKNDDDHNARSSPTSIELSITANPWETHSAEKEAESIDEESHSDSSVPSHAESYANQLPDEHFDYEEEDAWIREQKRVLFGNTNESTKECVSIQPTTPSLLTPTVASNLRTNSVSSKTKSKPHQYVASDSHASDTESEHRIPAVKPSSGVYSANTVENRPLSRLDALFKEQDAATAAYVTKNMPLTDTITPTIISARNESIASSTVATCIDKSEPETVIVEIPVSVEQNVTYSKITPTVELEVVCAEPLIPLTTEVSTTQVESPTAASTTSSTRAKTVHSLEIQLPTEPVAVLQIQTSNSEPVLQTLKTPEPTTFESCSRNSLHEDHVQSAKSLDTLPEKPSQKNEISVSAGMDIKSTERVDESHQTNNDGSVSKEKKRSFGASLSKGIYKLKHLGDHKSTDHLKETTASKSVQDIDTQNTEATSLVIQPAVNVTVEPVMGTNASHFQSTETIALQDQTAAENRKSTPTAFVAIPAETAETKAYPAPTNESSLSIVSQQKDDKGLSRQPSDTFNEHNIKPSEKLHHKGFSFSIMKGLKKSTDNLSLKFGSKQNLPAQESTDALDKTPRASNAYTKNNITTLPSETPADIKYTDMDVSIGPNSGRYFNAMQMHHLQGADYETYNSNTVQPVIENEETVVLKSDKIVEVDTKSNEDAMALSNESSADVSVSVNVLASKDSSPDIEQSRKSESAKQSEPVETNVVAIDAPEISKTPESLDTIKTVESCPVAPVILQPDIQSSTNNLKQSTVNLAPTAENYLKEKFKASFKGSKCDISISEFELNCTEQGKTKVFKPYYPIELRRVIAVNSSEKEVILDLCNTREGNRAGGKLKRIVYEMESAAVSKRWATELESLVFGGMHAESMARSVLILVEKSDKESGKLIEKYVKEVIETSKRPLEIKTVQYNEFSVANVLTSVDFKKLGNIVCTNPDFIPRIQQLLVRERYSNNPVVLACEIDPVDAALGIVRSSIGKSNINVLHVSGVTLKREEGKMGGFLNKFK
ncbi:hypothetical protein MT418_005541 [Batrachochytrium dendrobatidis]